nr:unnamed protein product [Spirometra erinaceieuropaei]
MYAGTSSFEADAQTQSDETPASPLPSGTTSWDDCPDYPGAKFATITSVCSSPMINSDEAKDKFYEDPHALPATVWRTDKFIAFYDFNVCVGADNVALKGELGSYGITVCDDHGPLLRELMQNIPSS